MNIAIYKPGKSILFKDSKHEDTAGWSIEIVNFIKVLEYLNHDVSILSKTDNSDYVNNQTHYDVIFVFNGKFSERDYDFLNRFDCDKVLCLTDLSLLPRNTNEYKLIIGQTSKKTVCDMYFPFEALVCLNHKFPLLRHVLKQKQREYAFGGNERNRIHDILEYIYKKNCEWYGKSESLGYKNKVSFKRLQKIYKETKYSVVIADAEYYKHGFVTQRLFELMMNDVVAFVSHEYDSTSLHIQVGNFRRVRNYNDMMKKLKMLDSDKNLYEHVLRTQRDYVSHFSIEYFSRMLLNVFKQLRW